ncbi:MAG: hypothetical protein LBC70_06970 [Chitinispirillales bacterium]|jgi:hypothetical protein|nr:hypothetical protein [Chitinispirillales bacterium]
MLTLRSASLSADILDPLADRGKMGSRYCTGGYIWQVYDRNGRALLSGPHFPSPDPPPFDGQGMPEVFETPLGGDGGPVGGDVCVIGVGIVEKSSAIEPFHPRNNQLVTQPCPWKIEHGANWAVMTASQSFGEKSIRLRREVRLDGSRVASITAVDNIGGTDVNLRWFPHPFFPINASTGLACGKICRPVILPENAGYDMGADGMIRMKPNYPWKKGLFQVLEVPPEKLIFTIPHPVTGLVSLQTDYIVARCPIWANSQTFSFEPFIQRVVKPGGGASWAVSINFKI